jgi:hypothetical protein
VWYQHCPGEPGTVPPRRLTGGISARGSSVGGLAYALTGDFEGVLTLALGLHDTASIRVAELPGHWYIDLRT